MTLCIICSTIFLNSLYLNKIAKMHGYEPNNTMSIQKLFYNIEKLPMESKLPENNLKNKLIIYYKFGCGDCESIHNTLKAKLKEYNDIYIVYTRSKQGKKLRKTYPVEKVPSGLYIQSNGEAVTLPLYTTDTNGNSTLNEQNLNTLLQLFNAKT